MRLSAPLWLFAVLSAVVVHADDTVKRSEVSTSAAAIDDTEIGRVLALSDDADYGEYLAGECASCHAAEPAARKPDSTVPIIHGIESTHIVRALLEYRSGMRSNTTMANVASALNDEEIAVLAHYLASVGENTQ